MFVMNALQAIPSLMMSVRETQKLSIAQYIRILKEQSVVKHAIRANTPRLITLNATNAQQELLLVQVQHFVLLVMKDII